MNSLIKTGITFLCLSFVVGLGMVLVCKFMPKQEKKAEVFFENIVLEETGIDITPELQEIENLILPESPQGMNGASEPTS